MVTRRLQDPESHPRGRQGEIRLSIAHSLPLVQHLHLNGILAKGGKIRCREGEAMRYLPAGGQCLGQRRLIHELLLGVHNAEFQRRLPRGRLQISHHRVKRDRLPNPVSVLRGRQGHLGGGRYAAQAIARAPHKPPLHAVPLVQVSVERFAATHILRDQHGVNQRDFAMGRHRRLFGVMDAAMAQLCGDAHLARAIRPVANVKGKLAECAPHPVL